MRGRKRTDLINQTFIGLVLMRSREGRGNRIVSTHPHLQRRINKKTKIWKIKDRLSTKNACRKASPAGIS
ncbi:hypothetical protein B5F96_14960 [Parabacteroides johnsonii]|uniref:Uncharacterized protein n=1 Tax=Parabacteroides johnsonii TaxID=387661 RepID=A0A9Q5SPM0_9BACT|nr:hypothetical protein B5F96_14960 [Parabacteroides johnsonii]